MADFLLRSTSSSDRVNSATYAIGDRVVIPRTDNQTNFALMRKYVYECTVGGVAAGTVPVYPTTPGGTVVDGAVTWTCREAQTWANAARYTDYIVNNRMAPGDRLLASQAHAESVAATITITFPGTLANPSYFICVDDSIGGSTPTTVATGASVALTGSVALTINGSVIAYGIAFLCSQGNISLSSAAATLQTWTACDFTITSGTGQLLLNQAGSGGLSCIMNLAGCRYKFASSAARIRASQVVNIIGGSALSGGSNPVSVFSRTTSNTPCQLTVDGFDFSNWGTSMSLSEGGSYAGNIGYHLYRNCKMAASWAGAAIPSAISSIGFEIGAYNLDSADTNYRVDLASYYGRVSEEVTIVRASGASNGVTPLAWKMVALSTCSFPANKLRSPEIARWNDTVGSSMTATIEIVHDSLTALNNDDIWLEVQYLGTSGFPLSLFQNDAKADVLATPAAQDSSSVAWTTTGLTNPRKQKLVVTFTPQEKGYILARVCMAKATYTVYADPFLTVA